MTAPDTDAAGQQTSQTSPQQQQPQPNQTPQAPPPTSVPPAPQGAATPTLQQTDANLQTLSTLEQSTPLPPLPGQVKFDLASIPGATASDIGNFFAQLTGQLTSGLSGQPNGIPSGQVGWSQIPNPATGVPSSQNPNSLGVQFKAAVSGLEGQAPPTVVDPNAVTSVRKLAISMGILPKGTQLDAPWTAADNSMLYQVQQRLYQQRVGGNEFGAVPTAKLGKLDFLNPTTMVAAFGNALLHSFYPSGKDISAAFKPELHQSGHQGGVLGFMHSIAHAITDTLPFGMEAQQAASVLGGKEKLGQAVHQDVARFNVALPILTDFLMLTGIGEVIGAGRAALMTPEALSSLYEKGGQTLLDRLTVKGGQSLEAAGEQGLLSKVLGRIPGTLAQRAAAGGAAGFAAGAGGAIATGDGQQWWQRGLEGGAAGAAALAGAPVAGDAMEAWRGLTPVQLGKAVSSPIWRVGTVETLAGELDPSGDIGRGVENYKRAIVQTPGLSPAINVLSLAMAPSHIFEPGTFSTPVRALFSTANEDSSVAKAMFMIGSDYQPEHTTAEVAQAIAKVNPDFSSIMDEIPNPADALTHYFGGDRESAGFFVTWAAHMAAIDSNAQALALKAVGGDRMSDPVTYLKTFLRERNQILGRLIHVDPNDVDQFLTILGKKGFDRLDGTGALSAAEGTAMGQALKSGDPEAYNTMNDLIVHHNEMRAGYSADLLRNHLQPGMVGRWATDFFNGDGNWHDFNTAMDEVRQFMGAGNADLPASPEDLERGLANRTFMNRRITLGPAGGALKLPEDEVGVKLANAILENNVAPDLVDKSWVSPLTRDLVPAPSRIAVARMGTLTTNDQARLLANFRILDRLERSVEWLKANPEQAQTLAGVFSRLGAGENQFVSPDVLRAAVDTAFRNDAGVATYGDRLKQAASTINTLSGEPRFAFNANDQVGGTFASLDQAKGAIQSVRDSLDRSVPWGEQYYIKPQLDLPTKLKQLRQLMNYTSQDVDVPEELRSVLADHGYKPVAGALFLHPQDMMQLVQPFADVSRNQLYRMSLGSFFTPVTNEMLSGVRNGNLRDSLLSSLVQRGLVDMGAVDDPNRVAQVNDIVDRLNEYIRTRQQVAQEGETAVKSSGMISRASQRMTNLFVPQGLRDLRFNQIEEALRGSVIDDLTGSDRTAVLNDVQKAIKDSYDIGGKYRGLASIEDRIRKYNLFTDGLLLGQTSSGRAVVNSALKGALVGGAFGAAGGVAQAIDTGKVNVPYILGTAAGGALTGATVGAMHQGVGVVARHLLPAYDSSNWVRYGYLPDELAHLRDTVRFAISPFFDARRAVKTSFLAQAKAEHAGYELPVLAGFHGMDEGQIAQAKAMWNAASRGNYDELNDTEHFFSQRGILNFSPKDWQAGAYYRLTQQGMDPEKAHQLARSLASYGARTAVEQSFNFVFFPFSFEKKVAIASAELLGDDFSRTLAIHDAFKTYDILNKHYDLSKELQDHFPLVQDLEKMNVFQHGVNLGELGGINAPYLRLFMPVMLHLEDPQAHKSAQNLVSRLLPAYNDINRLMMDLRDQGHDVFGTLHLTRQAEVDAGFSAMTQLKTYAINSFKAQGITLAQVNRASSTTDTYLLPLKQWYDAQKAKIYASYPSYQRELDKVSAEATQRSTDLLSLDYLHNGQPGYNEFVDFQAWEKEQETLLKNEGYDLTNNPEDIPPDVYDQIRKGAVWYYDVAAYSGAGDTFSRLYKTYFQRTWGPISRTVQ